MENLEERIKEIYGKVGTLKTNPNWKEDIVAALKEINTLLKQSQDTHFLSQKEWKERHDTLNLENEQKHQFVIMYVEVDCREFSSNLYDLLLTVFNDGLMYPQKHGEDDIYHIYIERRKEGIFIKMLSDYWERVRDVLKTVRMTTDWIKNENWSK